MNKAQRIRILAVHVLFWLLNYWFIAFGSEFNWGGFSSTSGSLADAYTYGLFFNAVVFYAQVFWLFPKIYLLHKKRTFYLLSIAVILIISILETYLDSLLYELYKIDMGFIIDSIITNTGFHLLYSIAGFYYILRIEYLKAEKTKQKLLEEGYKAELKYLKAQLNPHFLFNGINSVYHLIGKNNELAKDTLLQFSGLLRYQLYESSNPILLEKELEYVAQYIKIEKIRKGSDVQLQYEIECENFSQQINPLLLIPFIENAFKHSSSYLENDRNIIKIKIVEVGGVLKMNVINSFNHLNTTGAVGGIGLKNVKRRLSLLYPNRHQVEIKKEDDHFIVDLIIDL